jgi:hypothetical protein
MAKINAHGLRQVGPTLFTERDWKSQGTWDQDAVIYEAWRIRSDGTIQSRMIRSTNADGTVVEHRGSSYRNLAKIKAEHDWLGVLKVVLAKRGCRIVKEA